MAAEIIIVMVSRVTPLYGPSHANGMCLLDLPSLFHLKPIASTSSFKAVPHVATAPGPTSLPGGFIV